MNIQPLEFLTAQEVNAVHNTSMRILDEIGLRFPHDKALNLFREHGFKTENERVYFSQEEVQQAVDHVPPQFTIRARNREHDVVVGGEEMVYAPGYGAPFLIDPQRGKRAPTLEDYHNLTRLVQSLPNQDMSGYLLVEPQDVPPDHAHLYMLEAAMLYGDKPFIGSAEHGTGAWDTMEMAKILFGEPLSDYVTLGVISALSPLAYSPDMIDAIMVFAHHNQPMIFANLVMAGSTGPITLAGTIAQQNAELLGGITLAQRIQPGVPILYGTTSTSIDMRTGALSMGSPEFSQIATIHAQLARYYGFPSRGGGALTDASTVDAQAGYESLFGLLTAANSGIDFVLHAAGIMSSYLAFSYEKLIMDDEFCGMVRQFCRGVEVNPETLAFHVIEDVGPGGHFLNQPQTLQRCRTEFWQPQLGDRSGLEAWWDGDQLDTAARAQKRWQDLLEAYQRPHLEEILKRQITSYVEERTKG